VNGERIKLLAAEIVGCSGNAGEVLDDGLTVAAGSDGIRMLTLQRAGRAAMSAAELLRGFPIAQGTILR
jgi:methionyl-tRNA formyltransferase